MSVVKSYLRRAIFLDRDGVLCEDTDYVTSYEKLHIFPYARKTIERIHQSGYLAIVVTNQSAVARGMMSEEMVQKLNLLLRKKTGVDAVYYCPHLPPEKCEIKPYRIFCNCRKPGIGMLEKAALEFHIDLKQSYMIGDRISDIEAGRKAGMTTVFIYHEEKVGVEADFVYPTALEFAENLNSL